MTNFKMPSLRARIAAYKARIRYAGQKAAFFRRKVGRFHKATGPSRPKGYRAKLAKYNVHMYKRWATPVLHTASFPSTAYNQQITFSLDQVRGASELTALYDQYMIVGVKVVFQLVTNPDADRKINETTNANASNFYPKLMFVRDYDNITIETPNDLRERNNMKMVVLQPNKTASVYVRPAVRNLVYLDGVTPATSPVWNQWVDCSTTTVPHLGLKFSVDFQGLSTAADYFLRVETCYYLKFKNVR